MKDSKPPKPVIRLEPRRVELVQPNDEAFKAEVEESIALSQVSLEEAARSLVEVVEIHYIDKPRRESCTKSRPLLGSGRCDTGPSGHSTRYSSVPERAPVPRRGCHRS